MGPWYGATGELVTGSLAPQRGGWIGPGGRRVEDRGWRVEDGRRGSSGSDETEAGAMVQVPDRAGNTLRSVRRGQCDWPLREAGAADVGSSAAIPPFGEKPGQASGAGPATEVRITGDDAANCIGRRGTAYGPYHRRLVPSSPRRFIAAVYRAASSAAGTERGEARPAPVITPPRAIPTRSAGAAWLRGRCGRPLRRNRAPAGPTPQIRG